MYIENQDEDQNNQNQSSSSPSIGAGGGGAAVGQEGTSFGGNPSTISPIQSNQPNQKFATVQDYLKANQPQGEAFGQKFVSTVGEGLAPAKSTIDTSAQNAQNQITSGTINANPNLINEALKTPTSVANDAEKFAEFQKEYNAQYTGPSSFESTDQYTPAFNAANQAAQTGKELGTTGGREQLLQDVFGVYGQGNKGLDQTLLQNSSAFPGVAPLAQNFQSVQDYLKAAAANINTAAQNAASTTAATRIAATQPFANNLTNFQNDINSRVGTARTGAQAKIEQAKQDAYNQEYARIRQQIDNWRITDAEKNAAATSIVNNAFGQPTLDMMQNIIGNPNAELTAANVASPEDYANAEAYKKLTGVDYGGVLNPADITKAGTASNFDPAARLRESTSLRDYLSEKEAPWL